MILLICYFIRTRMKSNNLLRIMKIFCQIVEYEKILSILTIDQNKKYFKRTGEDIYALV